jgi:electron transport complex protein RnfC
MNQTNVIKVWDIPGGVHPPENKSQSMALPLAEFTIPAELIFPVNQHLGTPAEPIVAVGDYVKAGQKIAEAVGALSVPIHASTSGTISAIEDRVLPHTSGMSGLCIVLTSDGKHTLIDNDECPDYCTLEPKILIEKIRNAGIAGLGGAGFPTAVKLNPRNDTKIDTLILNGTECEPYITADDSLMQHFAAEVVAGAELLAFILREPKRVVIGIEDNKPDAIAAITAAAKNTRVEVATFPTKYPSGGEKQLIQILTGKEVPSGKIPAMLGIVVQNVGTAMAAWRAVRYGEALTWRITTVVGEALDTQRNSKVLLGTPVRHLLNEHGFKPQQSSRLIMGGPMMGFALPSADVPVVKTTNCIIAPSRSEMPEPPPAQACIRCGLCAEACPASLLPQQLYWYARAEEYERLQNHNLFDCIECGACSYVCPSTIPLVQYYRAAKATIRHHEQEKIKSDHARQRFEFRKQRMEQAEQEKEVKRLARKQAADEAKKLAAQKAAAKPNDTSNTAATLDPVAAAMARVQEAQQDPARQQAKLERAVSSAQSRVEKLQERLQADGNNETLAAQLKQAELRLQDAQKNLTAFSMGSNLIENKKVLKPASQQALDAASAAIEKAKVKADAMAQMSPAEKLTTQVASLETRVQKAREKIQEAEAEGSEHIDALRSGLEKMEAKLAATKTELENI